MVSKLSVKHFPPLTGGKSYPPPLPGRSKLYERLRAARQRAGLSQLQVAQAAGVSRAAVALWESTKDDIRTHPNAEQVMVVATLCDVPATLLLDDSAEASTIALLTPAQAAAARYTRPLAGTAGDRRAQLFWQTVQLAVLDANPALERCFGVQLERDGCTATAPFLHKRAAVWMLAPPSMPRQDFLLTYVPPALMVQALLGRALDKHLFVLNDAGSRDRDGTVVEADVLGCTVTAFSKPQTAAEALLAL